MKIYEVRKGRYAYGSKDRRAFGVVDVKGTSVMRVRGQRPILDERFKPSNANAKVRAEFSAWAKE